MVCVKWGGCGNYAYTGVGQIRKVGVTRGRRGGAREYMGGKLGGMTGHFFYDIWGTYFEDME